MSRRNTRTRVPPTDRPMTSELKLGEARTKGPVSAILQMPEKPEAMYVFAHGAGANMRHHFMQDVADAFEARNIATLRFNFPYMEEGRSSPNPQAVLEAYVRSACEKARELAPKLPLFAGGKSMGGRMTSNAASTEPIAELRGIIFFGFPLHQPKKPGRERAAHLQRVTVPMLFLQGTRDDLADLSMIKEVCAELPTATLHIVEGGNHSFDVPKKTGRTATEVQADLVDTAVAWMRAL